MANCGTQKKTPQKENQTEKGANKVQTAQKQTKKKHEARKTGGNGPSKKAEAIIAKPSEGYTFADVLKTLRNRTENDGTSKVKTIRKTRTGSLLLELEKGEQINPELLHRIRDILKESAEIKSVTPKITLEIRDLDSLTTSEEIEKSIRSLVQAQNETMIIRTTKPNSRELVRAFATVPQEIAEELLKIGYVKVGWCRGRLKKCENVRRCFRCFGIGHEQWNCTGPDRKSLGVCIRCGEAGHIMKTCKNEPKCCLCTEAGHSHTNHLPGSRRCSTTSKGSK